MTDVLFYDVETFSEVPIRNGLDLYSRSCEIMLVQWALGDGPVHVADIRESGWPGELVDHFQNDAIQIVAHNSAFERQVHEHQTDFDIDPTRWRCSMVRALAHSLPASLDDLCTVLQLGEETAKLKEGKSLIKLFCCPRPKNMKLRRATKDTHPDEWARFLLYARNDITAMRECWKRMPAWNYPNRQLEVDLHHLDQKINQRGLPLDLDLIHGALEEVEAEQARLKDAVTEATDGEVTSGGQRDKLIQYIMESYGVEFVDLRASTLADYLKGDDIPPGLRMLIELRQAASKTSTTKYKRMLQIVGPDGRARNTIQFVGASRTGRDCLAEGTPVLVKRPDGAVKYLPIEKVTTVDMVFDGNEWVRHDGVVFSGDKDVIEHGGISATPVHVVYVSSDEAVTLGEAKEKGLALWTGNTETRARA